MATTKLLIAGSGGQGVMVMGQMIAKAAILEGKKVTYLPSYGPEMRGGTANCSVIVSDNEISCPVINAPTDIVVMNLASMRKFEGKLSAGGRMFVNQSLITQDSSRDDIEVHKVDAVEIAKKQLGNEKTSNMVMLGAIVRMTKVVKMESIQKVVEKTFAGKKAAMIPLNLEALEAWQAE